MKYWGLLAAKLGACAAVLSALWYGMTLILPPPHLYRGQFFAYDLGWTLAAGLFFLLSCGAGYVCFLDQRYRCRVCARRLRMPVVTGSWGQILQRGRPGIEYICAYGHGTLRVEQLQLSGIEYARWTRNEDMWAKLLSVEERER